jgi:hypothetical protein
MVINQQLQGVDGSAVFTINRKKHYCLYNTCTVKGPVLNRKIGSYT